MDDTRIGLTLDTGESTPMVEKLRMAIEELDQKVAGWKASFAANEITLQDFNYGMKQSEIEARQLTAALLELEGADEGGGFKGVAKGIVHAEHAINALSTGTGLNRIAPQLDHLLEGLGMTSGLGFAIVAVAMAAKEYGPEIAKFFSGIDSEEVAKAHAELKQLTQEVEKLEALKDSIASREMKKFMPGMDLSGAALEAIQKSGDGEEMTEGEEAELKLQVSPIAALQDKYIADVKGRIDKRILKANGQRAAQLVKTAGLPGSEGDVAREELKKIAQKNPEFFPPEFLEFLESTEKQAAQAHATAVAAFSESGMDAEKSERMADLADKANPWAMERLKDAEKTVKNTEKQRTADEKAKKDNERETDQAVNSMGQFSEEVLREQKQAGIKQARAALKAAEDKQRAVKEQGREQDKWERDLGAVDESPEALNAAQRKAESSQALGLVQANTQGFSGDQQAAIAKHLQGNHQAGIDMSATFEQALAYAIQQTRADIQRGIAAGMKRSQVYSESYVN